MEIKAPDLDDRTSEMVFKQTIQLAKYFCPEWAGTWQDPDRKQISDDPGLVMLRLFSRMTEHLIKQMNRIPEKHRLAFLDFMGIDLLPAKPSRVPLTFYMVKKVSGARIPKGTVVAARPTKEMIASKVPEIVFETGRDLDVVPVIMSAVYSLNPWEDKYTDHSEAATGKEDGFLVFGRDPDEMPLGHVLYLGDDVLFDLKRESSLTIKFYGENLLSTNYFNTWLEGKKISLDPKLYPPESDLNGSFIRAEFLNFRPISKSLIDKEESFWLSVKPMSGIKIQNPINYTKISTEENRRFKDLIAWNFGEEWKNASIEKTTSDDLIISVETPSEKKVIPVIKKLNEYERELYHNGLKYIVPLDTATGNQSLSSQPTISKITVKVSVVGILPEMAFYNDAPIDTKKGFYPFGEIPRTLDTLYIASEEAFSKAGSTITLDFKVKKRKNNVNPGLAWEYWNGKEWSKKDFIITYRFETDKIISFTCPKMELININGQLNRWIRVRIEKGNYGEPGKFEQIPVDTIIGDLGLESTCKDDTNTRLKKKGYTFGFQELKSTLDSPFITSILINYKYENWPIQRIKSYNNFQFKKIKTAELKTFKPFDPYEQSTEKLPALYLGFEKDETIKSKPVSIFFAVKEKLYKDLPIEIQNPITPPKNASGFLWEYFNGTSQKWEKFVPEDETGSFNKGGIVTLIINTNIAGKPEFDKDLYWIKITPGVADKISCPELKGIFPNSVWARNSTTVEKEILGSGNGQPEQTLSFSKKPILKEQIIEVKEAGKPSGDELEKLKSELIKIEDGVDPLRIEKDEKTGEITEVWVRWNEVRNFSLSGPLSRDYVLDRANGMIIFGNGVWGMLPPRGKNNILARKFNSGGSSWGNCKAGTIDQMKRKIPGIEKVTNHISASGGMDQENLEKAVDRGPHSLKNRDRAVTKEDFEWLAREASQDVARAKCIPETGKINIIIVPNSTDDKPLPESGLLDEVKRYLGNRALLGIGNTIKTLGPDYKKINATVNFTPNNKSESAAVSEEIKGKIKAFLHPVHGGQYGNGWDFGEKIFLSEAAAIIQGTKGVDSIKVIKLEKIVNGNTETSEPGWINIEMDALPYAGEIVIIPE